jgi:zinc resistance-associated protein
MLTLFDIHCSSALDTTRLRGYPLFFEINFNLKRSFYLKQRSKPMNEEYRKSKILLIAVIAILFSVIHASADGGKGYNQQSGMHQGRGWHHGGSGGPGCNAFDDLSADEIKKLDEERTTFFEAAKVVRRKIYQKWLELASEIAKENPDAAIAAALQKEVSDFKAQLDQKHLEHILRVRKINPDLGRGFWGGGPMGPRMMHRGMMEPGGEGSWGPDNCPYGGSRDDYRMGPRIMHRGGYGMGSRYGRGTGMMGPGPDGDSSRQYYKGQGSQAE